MLPIIFNIIDSSGSGASFDSDYQAVITRATALGYTLPSAAQRIKQNAFVLALKAAGLWTISDFIRVFTNDGSKEFGTLNWKNPLLFQATLVNSPTWTSNVGIAGNGTTSYVNENFIPSTDGVNYTMNGGGIYCKQQNETPAGNTALFGTLGDNGSRITMQPRFTGDLARGTINTTNTGQNILANTTTTAGWLLRRTASNLWAIYKDGVSLGTNPTTSNGRPDRALFSFARNNVGVADLFAPAQYSIKMIGASYNGLELAQNTACVNYITSL